MRQKKLTELLWRQLLYTAVFIGSCLLGGCGLLGPPPKQTIAGKQLDAFYNAGPMPLELDQDMLLHDIPNNQSYMIEIGDLLELQMPATLQIVTDDIAEIGKIEQVHSFSCRVSNDGTISLPIIGSISARGKTLLQLEEAIEKAYFPRYVVSPPAIVSQIKEYRTDYVSVTGAVEKPGTYRLRSDQMTLVSLLMEAGGILETGATVIRITQPRQGNQLETEVSRPILMPIKGLNIPFSDIALQPGAVVEVHGIQEHVFTVMGLVKQQGTFTYPINAQFNLPQALAFAGGVNEVANPRFVHIYRPDATGQILDAVFSIQPGQDFAKAMAVVIKAGDVISVEQTPQTRRNLIMSDILQLRANVGIAYTK